MGMSNRNEIIERLENLAKHAVHYVGEPPFVMSLDDGIALHDAIALLKAQEPQVMTLEEVGKWVLIKRVDREPIFIEVKDSISAWIVSDGYWDIQLNVNLCSEFYGIIWRCWTSRPSDEQREATPWTQTNGL